MNEEAGFIAAMQAEPADETARLAYIDWLQDRRADPFYITGPAVISFSGGRTSAYMLWRIIQAHGGKLPPGVVVVFMNTGRERNETLDFVERCACEWGIEIVWLEYRYEDGKSTFAVVNYATASRNGEPFAELIRVRKFLPNPVSRFCTQELKVRILNKYLRGLGWETWEAVIGIRADEPHRVAKGRANAGKEPYDKSYPLHAAGVGLAVVMSFWKAQPFDLALEQHEGNCDLCFLKGQGRILRILESRPDLADWWVDMESTVKHADGGTDRFRRDRPGYAALLDRSRRQSLPMMGDDEPDELSIACHCTD